MAAISFSDFVLYFSIYSVIGWFCETVYCSIPEKRWVSRGFLRGPYCLIYGFGALLILFPMEPLRPYPPAVFICAVVLTSALEYAASWLMEKLFGIRWWDYSKRRFNMNGRVCLLNSVLFGIMGLAMVYLIHPPIERLVVRIPNHYERVIGSVLVVLFLFDLLTTLNTLIGLEDKLKRLQSVVAELRRSNEEHFDEHDLPGSLKRMRELHGEDSVPDSILEQIESINRLQHNLRRLLKSFPDMRHTRLNETLDTLKTSLRQRREKSQEKWNHRLWGFAKRVGIKTKAAAKEHTQEASFAAGINFYKLCWIFFLSCVIGYLLETVYCLVQLGHIESRQGMIYGPFNQVYGFGAVIMVLLLHRLTAYKDRWIFLASAVIGGAFEYVCSLLQELMFGTVSWEYSEHQFNIGGRTSLQYMFFWGILGVVLIKSIYPRLSRLIERTPNRQGVFVTWVILILLCADLALSGVAVGRWAERSAGTPPQNTVEELLDKNYPDEMLREIYPNMQIVS